MNKPLAVISCPIDTYSGYGARARDFVKSLYSLKKDEWEIKILSQRWGNTAWGCIENEEEWSFLKDLLIPGNQLTQQPDYWFQVTIPNEFQPIGKLYNVGLTAGIETTMCDPTWLDGINRMHLTLVSSQHAKNVFKSSAFQEKDQNGNVKRDLKCEKPVEVLFEGANLEKYFYIEPEKLKKSEFVKSLNEIKEDFNYLIVGQWIQGDFGQDRKNISGSIKLFLETFKDKKKKPGLIIKTTKLSNSILDRDDILEAIDKIRNSVNSKDLPNIYFLHGEMTDEEMNQLYNHPKVKAMLYLGHGEGFGRPLLEFSLCKKPVIASGWSGHMDFLNPEFTVLLPGKLDVVHHSCVVPNIILKESMWFYVDEPTAQETIEDVFQKYDKYVDGAKRQSYKNKTSFSFESMTSLLKFYVDEFPKPVEIKLPKLKKISL